MTKDTKLLHLPHGTINGMDGKPYKTRSGETPKLDDLFNEVKEKYAVGGVSKWEMDSISFYYHDHELKNVNIQDILQANILPKNVAINLLEFLKEYNK